jgi:site-specific DNA recombinase
LVAHTVSAYDLEHLVCERLSILLTDQQYLCDLAGDAPVDNIRQTIATADLAAAMLRSGPAREKATLLPAILTRIDLREDGIDLTIDQVRLGAAIDLKGIADSTDQTLVLTLAATKVRHGHQLRLIIPGLHILNITPATRDEKLVALVAEAHMARKLLAANPVQSIASIATSHNRCRTRLGKQAALACLAPDIVTAIVEGQQPPLRPLLTARTLQDIDLPLAWADQRALLGFA